MMLFQMSLELKRVPEVKPEVPIEYTLLSFWAFLEDRFKFLTKFRNRKYPPQTGSFLKIHNFETGTTGFTFKITILSSQKCF